MDNGSNYCTILWHVRSKLKPIQRTQSPIAQPRSVCHSYSVTLIAQRSTTRHDRFDAVQSNPRLKADEDRSKGILPSSGGDEGRDRERERDNGRDNSRDRDDR